MSGYDNGEHTCTREEYLARVAADEVARAAARARKARVYAEEAQRQRARRLRER